MSLTLINYVNVSEPHNTVTTQVWVNLTLVM